MCGPVSSVHLGNTQYANTFIGRQKTCTFKWQRATSTNKLVFYRCLMHAGRTMKIAWMIQRNSIEWALVVHPPHRVDVGKLEIGMREIRFARNQWIWASANKSNRIIVEMGNHELDQFYATPCNGSKTQFIASLCVLIGIWCWFECDGNGSVRTKQKKKTLDMSTSRMPIAILIQVNFACYIFPPQFFTFLRIRFHDIQQSRALFQHWPEQFLRVYRLNRTINQYAIWSTENVHCTVPND